MFRFESKLFSFGEAHAMTTLFLIKIRKEHFFKLVRY